MCVFMCFFHCLHNAGPFRGTTAASVDRAGFHPLTSSFAAASQQRCSSLALPRDRSLFERYPRSREAIGIILLDELDQSFAHFAAKIPVEA